ncbi:MAG TPA: LytR C-terminal domain-containing protein [Acidimicrobiales bacterium]|nr:LytR C-terminal domain-containing protein [Acidimicrobiales bacterium]
MSRAPEDRGDGTGVHEGRTQIGKAVVLILVAAVIAVLVLYRNPAPNATDASAHSSTTSSAASTTTSTTLAPLKQPKQITVQVLNGLQTGSLAGNLSTTLHGKYGYQTLAPLNTTAVTHTSVIYVVTHGFRREAHALARTLGLPATVVHRGVPAHAPVPSSVTSHANLIVVIGTSLQAKAGS